MRGFTLLETIIYLALFSLVISGWMIGDVMLASIARDAYGTSLLTQDGEFIMQKIAYSISANNGAPPAIATSTLVSGAESLSSFVLATSSTSTAVSFVLTVRTETGETISRSFQKLFSAL